jgi:hypothetical protein
MIQGFRRIARIRRYEEEVLKYEEDMKKKY